MPSNNSKYTQEIREKTARYILENKKSATSVAEEMGIDTNTVCRWVRDYRRNFIPLLSTRFLDYLLYKKCNLLWQKKIFEYCIMIMPEIEGVNLTCGRYDRNYGDSKGAVCETKTHNKTGSDRIADYCIIYRLPDTACGE